MAGLCQNTIAAGGSGTGASSVRIGVTKGASIGGGLGGGDEEGGLDETGGDGGGNEPPEG